MVKVSTAYGHSLVWTLNINIQCCTKVMRTSLIHAVYMCACVCLCVLKKREGFPPNILLLLCCCVKTFFGHKCKLYMCAKICIELLVQYYVYIWLGVYIICKLGEYVV